jgi:electron transfer flavoprotein alpha subunit
MCWWPATTRALPRPAAAQIAGVTKVIHAEGEHFAHGLAENMAAQVLAIASGYSHILFPATASGKNIAPRVAAKLDVGQVSDITKVESPDTFERPDLCRQRHCHGAGHRRGEGDHRAHHRFRPGGRDRRQCCSGDAGRRGRQRQEHVPGQRDRQERAPGTHRGQDHRQSGGRALGSAEKFNEVMTPLADKLGAALGASRAAVDAGYAPNDWQVGQTGKIVAPQLYMACGISGAIQHLAGMKDSKVIVAINKDPEAPIFSVADYGLEADLFTAVPELIAAL